MKTLSLKSFSLLLVALIAFGTLSAQNTKKELKKELKAKVERECRKTARTLKKNGWEVMPGKLPIEKQIQESRFSEIDLNENGERLYFTATHSSVGGNYSSAKKMASSRAMEELAEKISVDVAAIVENNVSSMNLGPDDIQIIDKCLAVSKQKVFAKINGAQQILEIFRTNDKGACEIRVMYRLSAENALNIAKQEYTQQLKNESTVLAKQLDEMFR